MRRRANLCTLIRDTGVPDTGVTKFQDIGLRRLNENGKHKGGCTYQLIFQSCLVNPRPRFLLLPMRLTPLRRYHPMTVFWKRGISRDPPNVHNASSYSSRSIGLLIQGPNLSACIHAKKWSADPSPNVTSTLLI